MFNINTVKKKISKIPFIGTIAQTLWLNLTISRQLKRLQDQQNSAISETNKEINLQSLNINKTIETTSTELSNKFVNIEEQIDDVKHRIQSMNFSQSTDKPGVKTKNTGEKELFADNHDLDEFYVKFENKFRGTEDEIKERLKVYVPYFKKLSTDFKKKPVLDIGCGRGELLDLLRENNIRTIGLDINETMVNRCKERGFEAVQADALDYLMKQKAGSVSAITGFHIVEHIPFSFLLRLFEECHRVLTPGGIIIFETPNPENIHVGSFSFYFDPSHLHPLPPDILAFAIENRGFEKVDILRLHPSGTGHENDGREDPAVSEIVRRFYMEQDYAVIGHKAG